MAAPTSLSGKSLLVKIETSTPGTYATVCGLKARSHKMSRPKVDTSVQDCDDSSLTYTQSDVGPLSHEVTGSGVAAKTALPTFYAWMEDGLPKNIQIVEEGTGWSTYTGAAYLTDFEKTGDIEGGKVEVSFTLSSSGLWTRTTNA